MAATDVTTLTQYFKGTFVSEASVIKQKLQDIKAYVFDWDGVFNNAHKHADGSSSFSETDSMGINLLRFNHHLLTNKLPIVALITGENNHTAFSFAKRESFHAVYYKIKHKETALKDLCKKYNLKPSEVLFVFDDVLDFSAAKLAGVGVMVNHSCNPLLIKYAIGNELVDYLTFHDGSNGAIREATELLIGLSGHFNAVIEHRMKYTAAYQMYIGERNAVQPQFFTLTNNELIQQIV